MRNKSNEGKACDAVIKTIEKRTGEIRTQVRRPEVDGVGPPVELRLRLGDQEYAIEHTRIEPFENQIQMETIVCKICAYFKDNLEVPFPSPAYYELQYPLDIYLPSKKSKCDRALKNLADWVRMNEVMLRDKMTRRPVGPHDLHYSDHFVHGKPDGFKCEFELRCWPDATSIRQKPGSLWLRPIYPEDMEPLRRKRLMRAFSDKCKKLEECKVDGARTVLVLESRDAALGYFEFKGDLLPKVLAEHTKIPDEIFLIQAFHDLWWVIPLKHDNGYWPDTGMPGLGRNYYDPNNSDIPRWLGAMPQHMREGLQLDSKYIPYAQGFAWETFKKDELNDLTLSQV